MYSRTPTKYRYTAQVGSVNLGFNGFFTHGSMKDFHKTGSFNVCLDAVCKLVDFYCYTIDYCSIGVVVVGFWFR